MAGEDLVVTSGLDLAGLQRDFRRGIGLADQFVSDLQRTLSSRELIGDLTPAGRKAGASLARGLAGSLTGVGTTLARSLDLSSAIAAQGAQAGAEFVSGLASSISGADDTLQRVVQGVDLSSGGDRAGRQFVTGITRVIAAEAPALRSAMGAALVPATVATDIGRLEGVLSGALARFPVVFTQTGAASGAALISGIAGELASGRQVLGGFAQETSRALTAALTIGDVSGTGERAGRLLAVSVASGITAEAPRVRGALATALVPSTLAPEVGRITGVFATAGQEIVGLLGAAGTTGGQALVRNLTAEVGRGAATLRQLTTGAQIGVVVDSGPVRQLVGEQQKLLSAVTETTSAMRSLDAGIDAIDATGIRQATAATRTLADAQREWLRDAQGGSVAAQALWQRQRDEVARVAAETRRASGATKISAAEEAAARKQVRAEIEHDIAALGRYATNVNATSRIARQAWLGEAEAIRRQAVEVGASAQTLQRLDTIIDQTTQSFQQQARAAQQAAAAIRTAGSTSPRFGPGVVDLSGFVRQTENAKKAITATTIAGKSFQQVMGRMGPAAVAVGFGLESLARGGAAADAGIRTALRSVASFAAFFGPKGLIVAGVAAATAAIIDLFSKSRDAIKQTAEQFQKSIDDMVKNVDTIGLQKQLKDVFLGTPTRMEDGTVEIRGGLVQLRRDLAAAEAAQLRAFRGEGGSIFKTSQEVDRLTASVAKQEAVYESLRRTILTLQSAGSDPALRTPIAITASASGAKEAGAAVRALREEIDTLSTAYAQLAGQSELQAPIAERLTDIHERINRLLSTQRGVASEVVNEYRAMVAELESIDAVLIETTRRSLPGGVAPTIEPPEITAVISKFEVPRATKITLPAEFDAGALNDSLRKAVDSFKQAQTGEAVSKIFGKRQQQAAATKVVNTETANLTRTFRAAIDAELALAASGKLNVTRINEIITAARALGIELTGSANTTQRFSDTLSDIGNAAFAIGDVVSQFEGMNREVSDAINSVGRLAGALSDVSKLKLSGEGGFFTSFEGFLKGIPVIGNLISSVVEFHRSAIGAISGKTENDANLRIMKENTQALKELALRVRGFDDSIGGFLNTASAIDTSEILATRTGGAFQRGFKDVENLDREFRAAGLSVFELKRRAEALGITITDAKGRISASGLKDLAEASRLAVLELTRFKNNLADRMFIDDARREILDDTSATAVANDWLDQIRKFAPDVAKKFFAGADTATKEGREIFEQGIRDVFDLAAANKLPPELLKAFGGVKAFVEFLLGADRALDDLTDTATSLNSEMVNVVQGFRDFNLDRATFNAQQGRQPGVPAMPPRPNPTPIPTGTATTSVGTVNFSPTIVLNDVGSKDIPTLSSEIVADLKRKARAIADPSVMATVNKLPA